VGEVRVVQVNAWLQSLEMAVQRLPSTSIPSLPVNPSPPDFVLHRIGRVVSLCQIVILYFLLPMAYILSSGA
jgi:hypothetical protein